MTEQTLPPFHLENTYHWPADGESRPWTEFWITTFSRPVGVVKKASTLFSLDQGNPWQHLPMEKSCVLGDQEVWHVNLGTFPANTRIRYAVEGICQQGRSIWDNCRGKDHFARIGSARDLQVHH
jgi:hypothetical protein